MKCFACGESPPDNSRFCSSCGVRLAPWEEEETDHKSGASAENTSPFASRPQAPFEENGELPPRQKEQLTRAERIQRCINQIIRKGDLPAFSQNIHNAMGLLGNDDASLRRLTNIILRDHSLLLAVMRRANSSHYNRSGRPICSATHAVAMLGADAVRNLANGLLLLEHFGKKSADMRALMLLSSLTASHVRNMALQQSIDKIEEAYLCGMFRNLGEVLIASYFPEEYASILLKAKQKSWSEHEACLSIMGFTCEDLGQAMGRYWKMPESVGEAMSPRDPAQLTPASPEKHLFGALISFCHELTRTVYRKDQEGARNRVEHLLQRYKTVFNLNIDTIREILDQAISETKDTFEAAHVPLDDLRLRRRTEAAVGIVVSESPAARKSPAPPVTAAGAQLMQSMESEVSATLESGAEFEMNRVILMVLEAIYRGGEFSRTLFCLTTPDRTALRGRMGLGDSVDSIIEKFVLSLSPKEEPLAASLLSGSDLYVMHENILSYRRSKTVRLLNPASFGIFPLIIEGVLVGCIYFDHAEPAALPNPEILRAIGKLRKCAVMAIERARKSAAIKQ